MGRKRGRNAVQPEEHFKFLPAFSHHLTFKTTKGFTLFYKNMTAPSEILHGIHGITLMHAEGHIHC